MWDKLLRVYWTVVLAGRALPEREEGQTLLEYAIVIAVAVLVVMGSLKVFGQSMAALFTRLIGQVTGIG